MLVASLLVVTCCLLAAVAAIGHRRRAGRERVRRLFRRARRVAASSRHGSARRHAAWSDTRAAFSESGALGAPGALASLWHAPGAAWWGAVLGAGVGLGVGFLAGGFVGAVVLAAYGTAGVLMLRRRTKRRSHARVRRITADTIAALAEDLSAGVSEHEALLAAERTLREAVDPFVAGLPVTYARRVVSAVAVARVSGAPLADVLHRLDADLRSTDRARAAAETQAAGARASAVLLATMPMAGIGLGTAIGIDPLDVLLHTTIGGASLLLSVALQLGGIAWTARLATVDVTP